jgi:hypothetical protein
VIEGMSDKRCEGLVPVSAAEVACFAYCPEQWRLEYGLSLPPKNRVARDAGRRHHARKAVAERVAGGSIVLGLALATVALLGLLVLFLAGGR